MVSFCCKIDSRTQFWNWTENGLLQGLYNNKFYNGDPVIDKLIIDKQSILVGGARLRQLRITPGKQREIIKKKMNSTVTQVIRV